MIKSSFFLLLSLFLFTQFSCKKNSNGACSNKTPESEKSSIDAYAAANSINGTYLSNGLYYQITNPGTGAKPTLSSRVTVNYVGKFTSNGNVFDQSTAPIAFPLGGLIQAWQIALPLIGKGGSIRIISPSAYCYGCGGTNGIPGNSVLHFDVELVDVN